jgi:putative transposase
MDYFREGYAIRDQYAPHFLTFTVCGWIDLFSRKIYRDIVLDAFRYAQNNQQLIIYGYVIMSNHIHLIAKANENQKKTLSDIVRDFKKFTHRQMLPIIESDIESRRQWMLHQFKYYGKSNPQNELMQIWDNDNHPEICYTNEFTFVKLRYIHENPVRAGIVRKPEDYIYSSASNYAEMGGILDVRLLY